MELHIEFGRRIGNIAVSQLLQQRVDNREFLSVAFLIHLKTVP